MIPRSPVPSPTDNTLRGGPVGPKCHGGLQICNDLGHAWVQVITANISV